MILNQKQLVSNKIQQIIAGYSAYSESKEVVGMLKKEIELLNLEVHEDCTEMGSWFIPIKKELKNTK